MKILHQWLFTARLIDYILFLCFFVLFVWFLLFIGFAYLLYKKIWHGVKPCLLYLKFLYEWYMDELVLTSSGKHYTCISRREHVNVLQIWTLLCLTCLKGAGWPARFKRWIYDRINCCLKSNGKKFMHIWTRPC